MLKINMVAEIAEFVENKPITYEIMFTVLSHERRRYALYCLRKYRTPMALADLADEVARLEHGTRPLTEISEEEVKRIYVDLYHSHVPKMEDANLLEYDQERDSVRLEHDLSNLNLSEAI